MRKPGKGADLAPFTTRPAGETLGDTKGRRHADLTMADAFGCYAVPSLAAGPSPPRQPERRQLTHDHDHEVAYVSVGAKAIRHRLTPKGSTHPSQPVDHGRTKHARCHGLTRGTAN